MPGPHPSLGTSAAAGRGPDVWHLAAGIVLLLAAAGQYTASTLAVGRMPAVAAGAAVAMVGGLALLLVEWSPPRAIRILGLGAVRAGVAGFVALGAVTWMVLASRHTDAPSGSVVAFWTTVFWGLILAAAPAVSISSWFRRIAGALLALAGAFGVFGNWERPSSFSLLTRFPWEQLSLAAAGVVWVVSVLVLASAARSHGTRPVLAAAGLGAFVGGAVMALAASSKMPTAFLGSETLLVLAVTTALVLVLTVSLVASVGTGLPAAALLLVPVAMSLLTIVEQATGSFGPQPLLVVPVVAGSILTLAGVVALLAGEQVHSGTDRAPRLAIALAVIAMGLAVVALVAPGVHATVRAVPGSGEDFFARFTMAGIETAGGWIALAIVVLVTSWASGRRIAGRGQALVVASVAAISASAWFMLRFTPLHTWVTWIPPEVQQDYGTEYAGIVFRGVPVMWQALAIATALVALLVVVLASSRSGIGRIAQKGTAP
ncbi:MAG: hypothetical protein Q8K99_03060 [Actinomycetota bacterium]|nr:hypothetical protein [Actinomycetota bacterium]